MSLHLFSGLMEDVAGATWWPYFSEFCKDKSDDQIAAIAHACGGCFSRTNFKGKSKYEAAMEAWKCKIVYVFLNNFPFASVIKGVTSHAPPALRGKFCLIFDRHGYSLSTFVDMFHLTPDNVELFGNYCNSLAVAYATGSNAFHRSSTGKSGKSEYALPTSCAFLARGKHMPVWILQSITNNNNAPLIRAQKIANLLKTFTGDRTAITRAADNITSWMWNLVSDHAFQQKTPGEQLQELEKQSALTGEFPHWMRPAVYPPTLFRDSVASSLLAMDGYSNTSAEKAYNLAAFMGIVDCDINLIKVPFPGFKRQVEVFAGFKEGDEACKLAGWHCDGMLIIEPESNTAKVFGQRVGCSKGRCPIVTESNLDSIRKGYQARFTLSKEIKAKINEIKEFKVVLRDGTHNIDHLVTVSGLYAGSMTPGENRKRKAGAAALKEKAIEKAKKQKVFIEKESKKKMAVILAVKFNITAEREMSIGSLVSNIINQAHLKKMREWFTFNKDNMDRILEALYSGHILTPIQTGTLVKAMGEAHAAVLQVTGYQEDEVMTAANVQKMSRAQGGVRPVIVPEKYDDTPMNEDPEILEEDIGSDEEQDNAASLANAKARDEKLKRELQEEEDKQIENDKMLVDAPAGADTALKEYHREREIKFKQEADVFRDAMGQEERRAFNAELGKHKTWGPREAMLNDLYVARGNQRRQDEGNLGGLAQDDHRRTTYGKRSGGFDNNQNSVRDRE